MKKHQAILTEIQNHLDKGLEPLQRELRGKSSEELLEQMHIFHAELMAQNETLMEQQETLNRTSVEYQELFAMSPVGLVRCNAETYIEKSNVRAQEYLSLFPNMPSRPLWSFIKGDPLRFSTWVETERFKETPIDVTFQRHEDRHFRVFGHRTAEEGYIFGIMDVTAEVAAMHFSQQLIDDLQVLVDKEVDRRIEAERTLQRNSRAAMMGQMLSFITHQWRQPLNALALRLELIRQKREEADLVADESAKALELTEQMEKTMELFRGYLRPSHEQIPFDAHAEIERAVAIFSARLKNADIAFTVSLEAEADRIFGLQNELTEAVANVITNAIEAFDSGASDKRIDIRTRSDGQDWHLCIEDNAGGIAPEDLQRIFDPYYTTKGDHEGTGLGLYLTQDIIVNHLRGQITATNIDGGTRFDIRIPISRDA